MVLQTQFADIKGNDLYIDGIKASDLAKQYGTPLYVMSEGHIRHQMNELKTKFMDKYEKALPLFASKSFSCLAIYKLASEYGIGIDCKMYKAQITEILQEKSVSHYVLDLIQIRSTSMETISFLQKLNMH